MSRIGKQPIAIPAKVKVEVKGQKVSVEGPKGKLNWDLPQRTSLKVEGDKIIVIAYCHVDRQEAASHRPRVVLMDDKNGIKDAHQLAPGAIDPGQPLPRA